LKKATENTTRKSEHLKIVLNKDVSHRGTTLLEMIRLFHQAIPELDLDEIDLSTRFFGKSLKAPLMITSMTGGAEYSEKINGGLAEVASEFGIAFAVGSQRVMLRRPEVIHHFAVRNHIPDGVLLGNIGAAQLIDNSIEDIVALAETIDADGLCVHLNPGQELIQPHGQLKFRGIYDKLAKLVERLNGNVLVKETGAGLSPQTLNMLQKIGIKYVDVSGAGGTSWTKVESYRASTEALRRAGETFADWGIPTAPSIYAARRILGESACVIASGGIDTGLDSMRALAMGADVSGFARSILTSFMEKGTEGAVEYLETHLYELKVGMLLIGAGDVKAIGKAPKLYTGELKDWIEFIDRSVKDLK